ncbi:MAG: PP2C family protein-serine/threonine phosphatase [Candidatus Rifleibacteriota bacterium]
MQANKATWLLKRISQITLLAILPLFAVFSAIQIHLTVKEKEAGKKIESELASILNKIEPMHDDRKFFHVFLQNLFKRCEKDPGLFYRRAKSAFQNKIKIITWNETGKLIPELCDEKKFSYLLGKMWQALRLINDTLKNDPLNKVSRLTFLNENIHLLRKYFGVFLVENVMDRPFLQGQNGSALFVSADEDKGFVWYQFGQDFSVACLIPRIFKHRNIALKKLCRDFSRSKRYKAGFYLSSKEFLNAPWLTDRSEFDMQLQAFRSNTAAFQESSAHYWIFRQITPEIALFAAVEKKTAQVSKDILIFAGKIFKFLLISAFIFYCAWFRFDLQLSIKMRLLLIVSFSTGLPLLLLVSSCYEYFNFQKQNLIFRQHNANLGIIKDLDHRYVSFQKNLAENLNQTISRLQDKHGLKVWPPEAINDLEQRLEKLSASEYGLFKPKSDTFFYGGEQVDNQTYKRMMLLFSNILDSMNNSKNPAVIYNHMNTDGFFAQHDLTAEVLKDTGKISFRTLSTGERIVYLNFLGSQADYNCWGMLSIAWDPFSFHRFFFRRELDNFKSSFDPGKILAFNNVSNQNFVTSDEVPEELQDVFERARKEKFAFSDMIDLNGKQFVASAMSGNNLNRSVIIALWPTRLLFSEIDNLAKRILIVSLIFISFTIFATIRFSTNLFKPLTKIETGLQEIQKRNFRHRLPIDDIDEFAELAAAFNKAIENMADLSLGSSVQEALLPAASMTDPQFEISAKASYMTSMGGDFYDYHKINDNLLHLAFGDVAGHGIPAALIMAMIKAHTTLPEEMINPSRFLLECNKIFLFLREKNWRRMMTLINLTICLKTGKTSLANAGHCYPILIRNSGDVEFIEISGIPLGSKYARDYSEVELSLGNNDMLLFYSDGFIEDVGSNMEAFGYPRFLELIKSLAHQNPEKILEEAFRYHHAWSPVQNDDLSMLIMRFKGKSDEN